MYKKGIFLTLNLIVLLSPVFSRYSVDNARELHHVEFGFPIPFISQDLSRYDPPFPYEVKFSSPWENPTSIQWPSLFFSLIIVNSIFFIFYFLLKNKNNSSTLNLSGKITKLLKKGFQ